MGFRYATGRLYKPRVSGDWWLAGGIDPANCIAAYQAKGAASKAASLVNLANPGTLDLTEVGTIDWTSAGWTWKLGANRLISDADITDFDNYTIAVSVYKNSKGQPHIWYNNNQNKSWDYGNNLVLYYFGTSSYINLLGADNTNVRYIHAGRNVFRNGIKVIDNKTPGETARSATTEILTRLGATNDSLATMYAISFYNATLTDTQAIALDAEMAAL